MSKIRNLATGNLGDIAKQQHRDQYATPLNGSSVGSGGQRFYGTGKLTVENEGLFVTGVASITGALTVAGTSRFSGQTFIYGPLEVTGDTIFDGKTDIGGNTKITGTFDVTGVTKLGGNTTVSGKLDVTGAMATKGTLSVEGVTTLKNNLNVDAGRFINLGSISLESGGANGGQINLVDGSLSSSAAFGTLLVGNNMQIGGVSRLTLSSPAILIPGLPKTTNKANLWVSATGRLYESTAA